MVSENHSHETGLSEKEVLESREKYGRNVVHKQQINVFSILVRQVSSNPLIIILSAATLISYFLGQHISAYYIFGMIVLSVSLGFWNEFSAEKTIESLLKRITRTAIVLRDGEKKEVHISEITVGDIVFISQGDILPADLRLLESSNLEINESVLTGESEVVYKNADSPTNTVFMGTNVTEGYAKGEVIAIADKTSYGKIAKSSTFIKPSTEFQKGLSEFGNLIIKIVITLTLGIFIINFFLGHAPIESLLFSLAIAVGLTPELLPIIVTICLSHGAGKLAKKHVVAKQLIAIENLGNIDVLCTDKTGTLTEGTIQVAEFINTSGERDNNVLEKGLICNTALHIHKLVGNSIDVALWEHAKKFSIHLPHFQKCEEMPFDFDRKAMFCVIKNEHGTQLIVKGAPEAVIHFSHSEHAKILHEMYLKMSKEGYRVVAIASKQIESKDSYSWEDVKGLTFDGLISFLDTPKKTVKESLELLKSLHVQVKVITGDNEIVAKKICEEVGIFSENYLSGEEIQSLNDHELMQKFPSTSVFTRVNPEQKSRIIFLLKKSGHTVGYLGDGINDIPSLRAADVGISVNSAVDVAKDAASIVLLRKSLKVLAEGIMEGRKTFSNTIKYILMATSSNFGNMFSAAASSFLLPFLPMTPVQILLTNGLYDVSQMTIPSDNVDPESLVKPRHWDINFIKSYMLFFGPLSSLFDFLTFGTLLYVFHAKAQLFQTGWFIESVLTEIIVVFVIRTSRIPFFRSKPSKWLLITCVLMCGIGVYLPFSPLGKTMGFTQPPGMLVITLFSLVTTYLILVELIKDRFLKKYSL